MTPPGEPPALRRPSLPHHMPAADRWRGDAVVVVAKAPVAGKVKTRLCPPLSAVEAADVAAALLADAAGNAASGGAAVWCAYLGDPAVVRGVVGRSVRLLPQRGCGLADRLAAAQADVFAAGAARVVLLGADCPTVEPAYLAAALAALDRTDVALGPAADGGYTLLAASRPTPELLCGVPMSTATVLDDTLRRAAAAELGVTVLAQRFDIDTAADLLAALSAGELSHAPRTRAAAVRLVERLTPVG